MAEYNMKNFSNKKNFTSAKNNKNIAFSIIFNTPFYTHLRFNQGRVISILEAFGLKKRFINSVNEITVNEQPDWQDVNQKISMWRDSSVSFLLSSLEHYYKNFSER